MTKKEEDFIGNFKGNREIISQFLVKTKEIKRTKNNKPYLELTLQDKTGQIKGRMFTKQTYKEFDNIEVNSVWNIVGKIQEFPVGSGKYNILIKKLHVSKKYEKDEFIRKIEHYDSHVKYLRNAIKGVENPHLKKILTTILEDPEFKHKFFTAPAAKIHHHNYTGGLLVHTNEVIEICETISNIYEGINHDLLITGAILHDIGKIKTYDYDTEDIEINYEGRMLDHIFIGANMLETVVEKIDTPKTLRIQLIHMILSHHGKTELGWGSTVDPKIPEAIALHHADDISAKITDSLE